MLKRWFVTLAFVIGCAPALNAPTASAPDTTCTSDLSCRVGYEWCAKPYGSMTGHCLQAVDDIGLPIYVPPRPSSSAIGGAGCLWGRRCQMGFWCDQGVCVR